MKHKISPVDFSLLCKAGQQRLIVDVRTPAEVAGESLPGSHHIPLQDLTIDRIQQWLQASGGDQEEPVYLLCASGVRAEKGTPSARISSSKSDRTCIFLLASPAAIVSVSQRRATLPQAIASRSL